MSANPNSCSDYARMLEAGQVAEYEDLQESTRLPDLTILDWQSREELARAIVARIEAIRTTDYQR